MKNFYYLFPIVLQKVGFLVFYTLHKIFVRVKVIGRENLHGLKKPVILASNHTSELDVTASPLILGFFSLLYPIYYVTDPEEKFKTFGWRNYIYGGIFFNLLGGYPIHSGFKDYEISLENFIDLLDKKHTIFIFPEGKRSVDGTLNPVRGGLGYLVYETGATVVPISINTFFNMSWWKYFGMRRKVTITILKPISSSELVVTEEPSVEDYREVSRTVMKRVEENLLIH